MKKLCLFLFVSLLTGATIFAQNNNSSFEVLYFKANLSCCQAQSCNALGTDVKTIVEQSFADNVIFKEVKLAENNQLKEKFSAGSQTLILVKYTKGVEKEWVNVSDILKQYSIDRNKDKFKEKLTAKVNSL